MQYGSKASMAHLAGTAGHPLGSRVDIACRLQQAIEHYLGTAH